MRSCCAPHCELTVARLDEHVSSGTVASERVGWEPLHLRSVCLGGGEHHRHMTDAHGREATAGRIAIATLSLHRGSVLGTTGYVPPLGGFR